MERMRRCCCLLAAISLSTGLAAPDESFAPGLLATYSDSNHRLRLVAATPNFYLQPEESVHSSLEAAFAAEWTGLLSVHQASDYNIHGNPAEVVVNGQRITAKPLRLSAGRHAITIRYRRQPGLAKLRLEWKSSHFAREPIPSSAFSHQPAPTPADQEQMLVERGRDLVEELGCVNCHTTSSPILQGRLGPDLTGIGSRVDSPWLVHWLENPTAFRASAVMPALRGDQQRRDVASYLASLRMAEPLPPGRRPGRHDVARGNQLFGTLGCAACHQEEGLWLEGLGSKTSLAPLAAFLKDPARFDPGGRMPSLLLSDQEAFELAAYLVDSRNPAFERPVTAGDPARGREVVESQGCLACHSLRDRAPLANRQRAPRLDELGAARGCLVPEPPHGAPLYRLSSAQREAMESFLRRYRERPDISRAPVYQLHRSLRQLRCVACHEVDHLPPLAALADAAPPLTDVGAKLRSGWIDEVLTNRRRVLGSIELRMPHYEARQARPLATAFARASGVEPGDGPPSPPSTDTQRARGGGMIGADGKKGGLACIGCHDWGTFKSTGEDGPQLINAAQRLRYDWFQRWMLNPARILSGTSMPNYFSSTDAKRAGETIDVLWAALSLGEKMPLPDGLRAGESADLEARPVPDREAIVVRWDMPEATPAAIAVGLPGGISYCFDAGESRLRYAWKGGFLDLSGVLHRKVDSNRLTPTGKLIGEIFYRGEEFPLRIGEADRIPQRRFRGWRLVEGVPQFHYQIDGIDVHERIVASPDGQGITRQFRISRVEGPMWFLDGRRQQIPRGADVRFEITFPEVSGGR